MAEPVLVTGATGFIGGRLCERLVQQGATQVRALVHRLPRAARIARLPVQLCPGDLLDRKSLQRVAQGVKTVVHLGLGYGPAIPKGTRNMLEVAQDVGVQRFVHMSTAAVYGLKPAVGCETEETHPQPSGEVYCDNKLRAEQEVTRFSKRGLPIVILRPSIVYGPYSPWSTRLIEKLRKGQVAIIDGGGGACNTVFLDNLVDAIFLAMENERAVGKTFFITDDEEVSWGEFIRTHAAMLEPEPVLSAVSSQQVVAYYRERPGLWIGSMEQGRQVLMSPEFRQMLQRIPICDHVMTWLASQLRNLDEEKKDFLRARIQGWRSGNGRGSNGLVMPDPNTWAIQTGTVVFRIAKARDILGFRPRVSFAEGINFTEQWLRFANYL